MKEPQVQRIQNIKYIGEQDGAIEKELKSEITKIFKDNKGVKRAYLAQAIYGESLNCDVILCINGKEDINLIRSIDECFSRIFNQHMHLDIIFIEKDKEIEVQRVCKPFYEKM